ncbi:hypothetical protein NV379_21745 [Paenibacillus sp. N1-5-1-14]|uniref:hypothetical protein n=1 Tax=Paenibacillus radicibacter TaxID=2972488 RepID=UPI0021591AFB|nr:hypothetical protein [Paenibacillus radicibacter]MCR8645284.1 hypothetical protein [Paenibacillus radicibacter]
MKSLNHPLLLDTIQMLQDSLSQEAKVTLTPDYRALHNMVQLIESYQMEGLQRQHVLGCYILLHMSLMKHQGLSLADGQLTKHILDGDYLCSMYYDLAMKWELFGLLTFLAPVHKQIQISRVQGDKKDFLLTQRFQQYLNKNYARVSDEAI